MVWCTARRIGLNRSQWQHQWDVRTCLRLLLTVRDTAEERQAWGPSLLPDFKFGSPPLKF
jgi:hypothetical protein